MFKACIIDEFIATDFNELAASNVGVSGVDTPVDVGDTIAAIAGELVAAAGNTDEVAAGIRITCW